MRYKCSECGSRELSFSVNATVSTDANGEIDWDTVEDIELDSFTDDDVSVCLKCHKTVKVEKEFDVETRAE
jgi:DNA-directed RNA polymerase subunit RPC12/RpoP